MKRGRLTPARRAAFLWLACAIAAVGTPASPARAEIVLRELLDDKLSAVEEWLRKDDCPTLVEDLRKLQEASPIGSRFALGLRDELGVCAPQDLPAAREHYTALIEHGELLVLPRLAWLVEHGLGGPADPERALEMYRRAALHYARYERGERYRLLGGVMRPRGIPLALWEEMLWVEQIEDGDAERKFRIAMRLKDGDGLPKMPRLAYRWLLDVSGARHPAARYELAMWQLEEGLPFADERFANFLAIDRLRWAAFYGHPPALVEYGTRLAQGRDVERNDRGAYIVLLRAKKAGMQVDDWLARLERRLPADDMALAREHFQDRHFFPFGIHDGD